MPSATKDRTIFHVTEGTIRALARERGLPKERLTPEVMEEIKHAIWNEFREWDNWLKDIIEQIVEA